MPAIREVVLRHWPLKLTALALSVVLWALIAAEEITTQLVSVQLVVSTGPTVAVLGPPPAVRALVAGPNRELLKLYAAPLVVRVAVPETERGPRYRLALEPSQVELPRGVAATVQGVEPREVEIALDRVVQRSVPVALRAVVVEAESGFAIAGRPMVTPALVRVRGPRGLVLALDSIPTEPIEVRGLTGPFERTVALDTGGRSGLSVEPREVILSGRVRRL